MDLHAKKILYIDLKNQTFEFKTYEDLNKFVGGIGVGLKLYEMYKPEEPVVFSIGPLNGFFPFASKTSIIVEEDGVVEDLYIGGNLSLRMRFCGIDSIVICNKSKNPVVLDINNTHVTFKSAGTSLDSLGLPGRRSILKFEKNKLTANDYFITPENFLDKSLVNKNVEGIAITGTEIIKPTDFSSYENLYHSILAKKDELRVEAGIYPSCSNCPMGCGKSKFGEIGGNVLIHSLVSCHYADKIYSDIGIVFSCLNVLGYDYTHEDLENLPMLIEGTLKDLS